MLDYYIILESSLDERWHITLAPAFNIDDSKIQTLIQSIKESIRNIPPLKVHGVEEKEFTDSESNLVPVLVLKHHEVLMTAHCHLMKLIENHCGTFRNPEYTGVGYSPHITYADLSTELPIFDRLSVSQQVLTDDFKILDSWCL